MDENENKKFSIDKDKLKEETIETAKKIKENLKKTNLKQETKETKGFITNLIKNPIETIKEIATDDDAKKLKTALILLVIWVVSILIKSIYNIRHYYAGGLVYILKNISTPIAGIIVYSLIIFLYNNKKKLTTIITTVIIAQTPLILSSVVSLLTLFGYKFLTLTTPFTSLCYTISIVLTYIGFKFIFNEDCKTFIKKFALIELIYYACYIIISFFGIYIQ